MIQRLLPHPASTLALILIWLLLSNSIAPGQILLGIVLGISVPLFTEDFWPEPVRISHPLLLLKFVAVVLWDILVANLIVAVLILGRPRKLQPAFVKLPLDLRDEMAISLLANTITLTPGTLTAQLAPDQSYLIVHALHETDPDALVTNIKQRYEKPLKEIFES